MGVCFGASVLSSPEKSATGTVDQPGPTFSWRQGKGAARRGCAIANCRVDAAPGDARFIGTAYGGKRLRSNPAGSSGRFESVGVKFDDLRLSVATWRAELPRGRCSWTHSTSGSRSSPLQKRTRSRKEPVFRGLDRIACIGTFVAVPRGDGQVSAGESMKVVTKFAMKAVIHLTQTHVLLGSAAACLLGGYAFASGSFDWAGLFRSQPLLSIPCMLSLFAAPALLHISIRQMAEIGLRRRVVFSALLSAAAVGLIALGLHFWLQNMAG